MRVLAILAAALLIPALAFAGPAGHAHNDYEHDRPLEDALDHGFRSVEADIWLKEGALLIGHDESDLDPARTLQRFYLDPLLARADSPPLVLLIDIKSEAEATYRVLSAVLADYAPMLSRVEDGEFVPGRVTAVVSGNRPRELMTEQSPRYGFYDGRLADLESGTPPAFMPLVSDNWTRHFSWRGRGEMPQSERARLASIVATAHAAGYTLRFWATPDRPGPEREAIWSALREAGVDYINTDDLAGLAAFLTER